MPLPKDRAWFAAKTYGWGWGLPCRWQGWVVLLAFSAALVAVLRLTQPGSLAFVAGTLALVVGISAIAYWKGEKPGWASRKRD
jgi:hypothetical protein